MTSDICTTCALELRLRATNPCSKHEQVPANNHSRPENDSFLYNESIENTKIRLVYLHPGAEPDHVQCTLKVVAVDEQPKYNALSYVWGDQRTKTTIICNGSNFQVTENLNHALCQFRKDKRTDLPFWIDVICINQEDATEKTTQVRRMKDIYEQSSLTIAWMGTCKDEDNYQGGFELMRAINDQMRRFPDVESKMISTLDELGLPSASDNRWPALVSIISRPYIQRVWIIQEFVVPSSCTIQCGEHSVDRSTLLEFAAVASAIGYIETAMKSNGFEHMSRGNRSGSLVELYIMWKLYRNKDQSSPLIQILNLARFFQASEPKDKIFALVALSSDIKTDFIDYTKSLTQIHFEVAQLLLLTEYGYGASIMCFCNISNPSMDLPSWVPAWVYDKENDSVNMISFGYTDPSMLLPSLRRIDELGQYLPTWTVDSAQRTLCIRGGVLDVISWVHRPQPFRKDGSGNDNIELMDYFQDVLAWHKDLKDNVQRSSRYGAGKSGTDALWRTLIANRTILPHGPIDDLDKGYKAWLKQPEYFLRACQDVNIASKMQKIHNYYSSDPEGLSRAKSPLTFTTVPERITLSQLLKLLRYLFWMSLCTRSMEKGRHFELVNSLINKGRRCFITNTGYIGWSPEAARKGDYIVRFEDCTVPFAMRKVGDRYRCIGECYVHECMAYPDGPFETIVIE